MTTINQTPPLPLTVVNADKQTASYFKDLFSYRELMVFMAWRDILVRYRQAVFGIAWAVLKPLLNMLFFTLIFGKIAHLPSDGINYSLLVLAGLLPWQLCSNAITDASGSLVNHQELITKVFFPRAIIPTAHIAVHFVDFFVGLVLLMLLTLFYGQADIYTFFLLPPFFLLCLIFTLGVSLWLSAATVQYRDFRFIVPFAIQFGIFVSPVGYMSSLIPEKWLWLYMLNPMVGIIDGFRWAFFGIAPAHFFASLTSAIVVSLFTLITGFLYFRSMEKTFADRI